MRIRVTHDTVYRYDAPTRGVIQTLRLTPRNYEGQYVVRWRIDISEDARLSPQDDAFGNLSHTFTADGPFETLSVHVEGEVETQDTGGIVRGTIERFPPALFLRETALTACDPAIAALGAEIREAAGPESLSQMHALLARLHQDMTYDPEPTQTATTAAEAYALKRGVCQDLAHIFIAAARHLQIPARYVGGYFHRADGVTRQEAGHAWAETYIAGLGWVAFDPANGISATDAHVRVAIGLDYLGAAPVRGIRFGTGSEQLSVRVAIDQTMRQTQS